MNKTFLRKTIFTLIVLFMVTAIAASNFLPAAARVATVEAANESTNQSDQTSGETADSGKQEPQANQEALAADKKLIEDTLEAWAEKQKQSAEATDKQKTINRLKATAGTLNTLNKNLPGIISSVKDHLDGGDFDVMATVRTLTSLASGIANLCGPTGMVVGSVIDIVTTLVDAGMGGQSAPSETALMKDHIDQRLNEIADQIAEVQDQLSTISNEINAATNEIISSVSTSLENNSDKERLEDFMISSGTDDFSYNQLRNCLYGETSGNSKAATAYYSLLRQAQLRDHTSEDVAHYYDLLYSSLWDKRENFHNYITGNKFGKSIVATYYDVLSARPDLLKNGETAELATIKFAYDLYQTELLMDELILQCNNYQYTQMLLSDTTSYEYAEGQKVLKSEILNSEGQSVIANSLLSGVDELRKQFAKDLVHVLNTTGSYIVEDAGHFYYLRTTLEEKTPCAKVFGQRVYLNTIPVSVCELFDLQADSFYYTGDGVQNKAGLIEIDPERKTSTISLEYLEYNDTSGEPLKLAELKLSNASSSQTFSGGNGTKAFPYLISTPQQFLNIAEGMDKHYCLIANINFGDSEINPIGHKTNTEGREVVDSFEGVLDGNGYSITNVKIASKTKSGIFAAIGENGTVKNLNISNLYLTFNNTVTSGTSTEFTGGSIAGINNGTIEYCKISGCTITVNSETNNQGANRNVYFKYGGVVGCNNGNINVITVTDSKISVKSKHSFGGADVSANENNVYVGGICGTCKGSLQYVSSQNLDLTAEATSILSPNKIVHPHLQAFAGGITTNEGLDLSNISKVHSSSITPKATASIEIVKSGYGKHYDNRKHDKHDLIPGLSEAERTNISTDYDTVDNAFSKDESYTVEIKERCNEITGSPEPYEVGTPMLNTNNLIIKVNDVVVEKDHIHILEQYGFTTRNENTTKEVKLLFIAQVNGRSVLLTGTFEITVAPDRIKEVKVLNYPTTYRKGETFPTTATVELLYASGSKKIETNAEITVTVAENATAELGKKTLTLTYNGVSCKVEIEVLCHCYFVRDYQDTTVYTFVQKVSATCQEGGYDEYACNNCSNTFKINRTGTIEHNVVEEPGTDATCEAPGKTKKIYCNICGQVFKESVEIPQGKHTFVQIKGNSEDHRCASCNTEQAHEYVVSEGLIDVIADDCVTTKVLTYTYTCYSCGYVHQKSDPNIKTPDERSLPTVIVSNGYALNAGDLVTVYVDLVNNPGVNGATFGIRYDENLELVDWFEGDFFKSCVIDASEPVHYGYNFVWAKESSCTATTGNLLKLLFRVPIDAKLGSKYAVSVVYTTADGHKGGFALSDEACASSGIYTDDPQKFITTEGIIHLVKNLPGDVTGNGCVNLLDALHFARYLANDPNCFVTHDVGDVNLSGDTNIKDVVKILQSICGGYGSSLLLPEYNIRLNTNGWDKQLEPIFVELYGQKSTYAAAGLKSTLERPGYKFLGWFTRMAEGDGCEQIEDYTSNIHYYADQKIQTLYAHWEKNSVSFDVNGATSGTIDQIIYTGAEKQEITLPEPSENYKILFEDTMCGNLAYEETMIHAFLYWEGSNGTKYEAGQTIDLASENLGAITLTAVWGDWTLAVPNFTPIGYHPESLKWYAEKSCPTNGTFFTGEFDNTECQQLKDEKITTLYAKWTNPITYYVEYDGNGATGDSVEKSEYRYGEEKELRPNTYKREYIVTFNYGWSGQSSTTQPAEYISDGWSREKNGSRIEGMVKNLTDSHGAVITVYARWTPVAVSLPYPNARTGYTFLGWYDKAGNKVGDAGGTYTPIENCTLEAKWTANEYTVTLNPNGGIVDLQSITVTYGSRYDSHGDKLPEPTKPGHKFNGWKSSKTGQIVYNSTKVNCASNDILVAQWTACTVHLCELDLTQLGTAGVDYYGRYKDIPIRLEKVGHNFMEWRYISGQAVTNGMEALADHDHILFAMWELIDSYSTELRPSHTNERLITEKNSYTEYVDPKFDIQALSKDYNYLEVTIEYAVREVNNGYQQLYITDSAGKNIDGLMNEVNYGGGIKWTDYYHKGGPETYKFQIPLDTLSGTGTFGLKWVADGADSYDDWYLGETTINVKAIQ